MNNKKGFTLIELLVVIAVIGILAAVVLASLNSARAKAKDKAIVSDFASVRTEIQSYFNTNGSLGSYSTWCPGTLPGSGVYADARVKEILTHANSQSAGGTKTTILNRVACYANGGSNWAVIGFLNEGNGVTAWCVDSAGKSKKYTIALPYSLTTNEIDTTNALCK